MSQLPIYFISNSPTSTEHKLQELIEHLLDERKAVGKMTVHFTVESLSEWRKYSKSYILSVGLQDCFEQCRNIMANIRITVKMGLIINNCL